MKLSSLRKSVASRVIGFSSALATSLMLAGNVLAQTSTGVSTTTKGGTSTALPDAGTTELTFLIFGVGLILFVAGTVKLALSFRE